MILAALLVFAAQPGAPAEVQAPGAYCSALLRDDLERRRAMRPFLASTDPLAAAGADAAIARDEAGLAQIEAAARALSAPDAAPGETVAAKAAKDISTLQSLQNAEDGCEATACLTQARAARDADPAWARLKDCQGGVP